MGLLELALKHLSILTLADLKATALLKLVYLEMFGHDMSWASFNVLEVMSSQKYLQKRVGYLGAVQSFRPNTEVLMLATNLLKKDITSASTPTISLPLVTLPHIITPPLALALQSDLLPRLSHSSASIRKKTVVTIYRLTLVYPETLRLAWPKIKDMLMDDDEDSSVTAAVINVVCELGWRRPHDFLSLAPRLFELLVLGGNNWMAIKIIKLFATLTPLEPRLIRKLLPPLTSLIRTTPAMSLLYECIHGIIQGGILESEEGFRERDEVAELCVTKLRGMIAVERDPNLKYVALRAFKDIVKSHPYLVAAHQDVILDSIGDPDISIRLQALELGVGMINNENLVLIVERLMRQLREESSPGRKNVVSFSSPVPNIEPAADSDGEDPEETLRNPIATREDASPLPDEYRLTIIRQILKMCSQNTYANVPDFDWYIAILLELVSLVPLEIAEARSSAGDLSFHEKVLSDDDVTGAIGMELRNVGVRVESARSQAVAAAASLLAPSRTNLQFPTGGIRGQGILAHCAWIVGEYADMLPNKQDVLDYLQLPVVQDMGPDVICAYLQAIPKVLASLCCSHAMPAWSTQQQGKTSLLLARIVQFLERLASHESLEVQERSVEFLELFRVTIEAVNGQDPQYSTPPSLLTHAIPALFNGSELGPVAISAQRKIPVPPELELSTPLNQSLLDLLFSDDRVPSFESDQTEARLFYRERPYSAAESNHTAENLSNLAQTASYQNTEGEFLDSGITALKLADRRQRQKDDPFYIASGFAGNASKSSPFQEIVRESNPEDVDIDSIPIMDLELDKGSGDYEKPAIYSEKPRSKSKFKVRVAAEENFDQLLIDGSESALKSSGVGNQRSKSRRGLLQVDSGDFSGISLNLHESENDSGRGDDYRTDPEEAEMKKALAEVENLRMEMQRASERIRSADGIPDDGTLVKKKRRKKKKMDKDVAFLSKAQDMVEGHIPTERSDVPRPIIKKTPI